MPTSAPTHNGNCRGSHGLRGTSGVAGRQTGAFVLAVLGLLAAGCSPAPSEVDVEAREAAMAARLVQASEVAASSLPAGAMETALLGYVGEGVPASLAAAPLSNTFASIDELAAAILGGIEQDNGRALWSLALTKEEFGAVVWPVLPASRPERNTPLDYTWGTLEFKSSNALNRTLSKHRGRHYELVRVDFVAHEQRQRDFGAFRVHRDARVLVKKADGSQEWLDLFGSVIERNGRFKVFSYVTD